MTSKSDGAQRRVVYGFLRASARLGERLGVSARNLQDWSRLAYFQELRSAGLTVAEVCEQLQISVPTGARLSRLLKTDFLEHETEHDLPKTIAFLLWSGPMSRARIEQVLPRVESRQVDRALKTLIREGRVVEQPGRSPTYAIRQAEDRLVRPGWAARLGALDSLLSNIVDVVHTRFFEESDTAFARTVTFRARARDRDALKKFYEETVWPFLRKLEEQAEGAEDVEVTRLSILWASRAPEVDLEKEGKGS